MVKEWSAGPDSSCSGSCHSHFANWSLLSLWVSGRRTMVYFRASWLGATLAFYRGQDTGSKLESGKCLLGCRLEAGALARVLSVCSAPSLAGPQCSLGNHRDAAQIYGPAAPEQVPYTFCLRVMVSGSQMTHQEENRHKWVAEKERKPTSYIPKARTPRELLHHTDC